LHLKLSTDRKFALSDENYLFECMGLTKTTSEELSMLFDSRIISFLSRSELIQTLPVEQPMFYDKYSSCPEMEDF